MNSKKIILLALLIGSIEMASAQQLKKIKRNIMRKFLCLRQIHVMYENMSEEEIEKKLFI
jgi:hypothetical protein